MTQFNFQDYVDQLSASIKSMAATQWADYKDAAIEDSSAFVASSECDLEDWCEQVALKEISSDDLEWLVKGKIDAAQLRALKEQGLAKVRLEQFRNSLVDVIVGSLVKVALK